MTKLLPKGRTAIIAGGGKLPLAVAQSLKSMGQDPFVVPLRHEADPDIYKFEHCEISIVEFAKLIRAMKSANVKNVVLAGGVKSRPHLSNLRLDGPTLRALTRVFFALAQGDDALLRAFIKVLESYGFEVLGAHEVVPDLLAPAPCLLSDLAPSKVEEKNLKLALAAAHMLGDLDVGQGAVAVGGRVVALEGAEGTDNMIKRIALMRQERRIPQQGGVLVKCAKPNQEKRADLPTIGPDTIEQAFQSGLAGVAIEAGSSFILDFEKTIEVADKRKVFLVTF
ncbi:LpxI family protein [Bartonella sp. HY329]|uniref:LpxI family protein n=1 Tax=unclassified Bartonella TaxID=2645622 RepID=UPI0021C6261E|nr:MULTISPECIES: LpxI family protein [unclassified Bartonella]UXM93958.1 LpxI family protein [Bartonella sp. HY329]UXN08279.1 LpxI family protein [Bartonella sp. HY328]